MLSDPFTIIVSLSKLQCAFISEVSRVRFLFQCLSLGSGTSLLRSTQGFTSSRMWSTGEGNGKPFQYSCLENPMNSMKRQNNRTLKEELPRSVGAQYAMGDQWRNNSIKNEGMEPKQKQYPVVDVNGDRSKAQCFLEQYCIGTWNIRSMNQGKLEVVKQEMASVNIHILGISELKWTEMGEFNSDDHYIYYCGQESHRRNGVATMVNKRVRNAVLGCNLKPQMISVCFQANHSISQ